jgi:hypothetical protein
VNRFARQLPIGLLMAMMLFVIATSPLKAGVIVTGDVVVVAPPASVVKGADTTPVNAILFQERANFAVPANTAVDVTAPGTANSSNFSPSPGTIAQGTLADVWFFHSDPPNSVSTEYVGTMTFDTPVLGIIDTDSKLNATDPTLGHPGTTYPTGLGNRGLESPDTFTLSANKMTISFDFTTSSAVDEIRILVAPSAVPEPSSVLLGSIFAGLLVGHVTFRRYRRAGSPNRG